MTVSYFMLHYAMLREGAKNTLREDVQKCTGFGRKWVPPLLGVSDHTPISVAQDLYPSQFRHYLSHYWWRWKSTFAPNIYLLTRSTSFMKEREYSCAILNIWRKEVPPSGGTGGRGRLKGIQAPLVVWREHFWGAKGLFSPIWYILRNP